MTKKNKHARVLAKDIDSAIRTAKDNPEGVETSPLADIDRKVCVFTLFGKHDYLDADNRPRLINTTVVAEERLEAYAKSVVIDGGNPRYLVKTDSTGHAYNPIGMYADVSSERFGNPQWTFREVNKNAFNQYLSFLRTRNNARLKNAEREMQ